MNRPLAHRLQVFGNKSAFHSVTLCAQGLPIIIPRRKTLHGVSSHAGIDGMDKGRLSSATAMVRPVYQAMTTLGIG